MQDEEITSAEEQQQDIKPVKLSIKGTVGIAIGLFVLLFIIVIIVNSCSVSKSVNSGQDVQSTQTVNTEAPESTSNTVFQGSNNTENEPNNKGSVSAPVENSTSGNNASSNENQSPAVKDDGFTEVASPELSDVKSAYGMVIGKHIYKKDDAYIYGVSLSVIINDQSVSALYFCPRKTFNELNSGDSLTVTYQLDSAGAVSIYSISK